MSSYAAPHQIADAIESLEWKGCSIGHKVVLANAVAALRATQPAAGEPVAFANELISGALQGGDFSGADIQELAVKHGLLREERREEPCRDEGCACAEYGFPTECYRKTAALAPPAAAHGDDTRRIDWLACTWRLGGTLPDVDHGSFREAIDVAMRAQGDGGSGDA